VNYGRIQRGPMAADAHFTQISNALFRDNRLSFRDKGVFGLISTHREGFGVTAESIAACSPTDGVTSVKSSLRNLETYGYLRRTRVRRPDGTLGGAVYFITDDPGMVPNAPKEAQELQTASSEPAVAQPPLAEPTQVEPTLAGPALVGPTLADLLHKNTNSKHTKLEEDLSPEASEPDAPAPATAAERETEAAPEKTTTAQRTVRASGVVAVADEDAFIAWVRAKYPPAGATFWERVAENGDVPGLAVAWRADQPMRQSAPTAPSAATCWTCNRTAPKPVVAFGHPYCPSCCEPCSGCRAATPADLLDMDTNRCPACRAPFAVA
jgi:hypothetical protein